MKLDHFPFQYTYADKADYNAYLEKYQAAYSEKSDLIRAGGFKIYTSLDSGLQAELQASVDDGLASYTELQDNGKYALQGAGVVVDNRTNYVVAIVGGRGSEDQFNRAYLSARQPGSTIKPLIDYGPAFDTGEYYPTRIVDDHKWEDGPSNSGGSYYGPVTVREALNPQSEHRGLADSGRHWDQLRPELFGRNGVSKALLCGQRRALLKHRRLHLRGPRGGHGQGLQHAGQQRRLQ